MRHLDFRRIRGFPVVRVLQHPSPLFQPASLNRTVRGITNREWKGRQFYAFDGERVLSNLDWSRRSGEFELALI